MRWQESSARERSFATVATEPGDLSSVSPTHMVEGEGWGEADKPAEETRWSGQKKIKRKHLKRAWAPQMRSNHTAREESSIHCRVARQNGASPHF